MDKKLHNVLILIITLIWTLLANARPALAQDEGSVQIFEDHIELNQHHFYILPNLVQGQVLYVYAAGTSDNLDPLIALTDSNVDRERVADEFWSDVLAAVEAGHDPLEALPEITDQYFLVWDDDSGSGYDAKFRYVVPSDGEYFLLVTTPIENPTFGDYQLTIGLDAPEVIEGRGIENSNSIAFPDRSAAQSDIAIQEVTGTLTSVNESTFYYLHDAEPGSTFYAFAEGTSGDLIPTLILKDFGNKPLRSGNFTGGDTTATLQYRFNEYSRNYILEISNCPNCAETTSGDYRLLVGMNAPEVLGGEAKGTGPQVLRLPVIVDIGLKMDQITDVDQQAENFGVVANIAMIWNDPNYAFSPDDCHCNLETYTEDSFNQFVSNVKGEWPEFTIYNQQGNRWTQNKVVALDPNGNTQYIERFTATMQAPDMTFRKFPFDTQDFYIRIMSVFPEEFYIYNDPVQLSGLGEQLGEEEWKIIGQDTFVDTVSGQENRSRYNFHFRASRNITFYIFRIFIPLGLIVIVSYITFFLKNYVRRIEVTTGNLLLFIAFNFTISDDLPRLGYLTFMDAILATTFIISVIVVAFNVFLRRLEVRGDEELALKIDRYTLWFYPLIYLVSFGAIIYLFLVKEF